MPQLDMEAVLGVPPATSQMQYAKEEDACSLRDTTTRMLAACREHALVSDKLLQALAASETQISSWLLRAYTQR